ncbi:MAG TPA: nuclear transport factor 2 family protein [Candidatus Saccharimonadales bacterium]|jgi:hypothetical protein
MNYSDRLTKLDTWLDRFKTAWTTKNMPGLTALFDKDVEYWETPYHKLSGVDEVMREWKGINAQETISVSTNTVMTAGESSTVQWRLDCTVRGEKHSSAGVYIIKLDSETGACTYFFQVGEVK